MWSCDIGKDETPRTIYKFGCDVGAAAISDADDKLYLIAKERDRDEDPVCGCVSLFSSNVLLTMFVCQPIREFIADNDEFVSRETPIVKGDDAYSSSVFADDA